MSVLRYVVASAAFATLAFIGPASAATIVSDELIIFRPNGNVFQDIIAPEIPGNEGGHKYESIIAPNSKAGPIVLTEPDGSISDIVGIFKNGTFGFLSDHVDGKPLKLSDLNVFAHVNLSTSQKETAGFINVTSFIDPTLVKRGFTASFASDFEVATPIPAALPLFASGLGVMGWISRRRKQKTSATALITA
jgi:hypothetical protein